LERSVTVRTPEAIAFYYELAGLGSRFLALLVDTLIQAGAFIVLFLAGLLGARRATSLASSMHLSQKSLESTVIAVGILLAFVLFYGYFIAFEKLWNGQTPGKRMVGIRVVRDGGYPVELAGSTIRNLIRIVEQLLGFYFISVICMLASSENKRLGDYAAGTIVVRDRGFEVKDPAYWLRQGAGDSHGDSNAIAGLSADELAVVDRYIERRHTLDPLSARNAATKIAQALRPKLAPEVAGLPDDDLLMQIASRERS
jgi:uncharacterized RDD family membrane protein YckC